MGSTWIGCQVKQYHGMGLLSVWDQHVESSCVLMHYYWNDKKYWVAGWQYVNCWNKSIVDDVASNYKYVEYL